MPTSHQPHIRSVSYIIYTEVAAAGRGHEGSTRPNAIRQDLGTTAATALLRRATCATSASSRRSATRSLRTGADASTLTGGDNQIFVVMTKEKTNGRFVALHLVFDCQHQLHRPSAGPSTTGW